jgi:hypothetical protein
MNTTLARMVLVSALVVACGLLAQEAKEFRGRLPPYYSGIVTEGQRREIYKIQERYATKVADLRAQLDGLTEERDAEIEGVLTAAQRQRLQKAREEAAAKRKKPAGEKVGS